MRHRLNGDEVPRFDFDQWRETFAEVAPVHRLISSGNVIVVNRATLEFRLRLGQRCSSETTQSSGAGQRPLHETTVRRVGWQGLTLRLRGEGMVVLIHGLRSCQWFNKK